MASLDSSALQRQCFDDASHDPMQARLLQLLLAQDGSTTRLCETIAGGPVQLHLLAQRVVSAVPAQVSAILPGERFIERVTCIAAQGQVMMDNLSYIALQGLPADVQQALEAGTTPIGHLFARMWVRRSFLGAQPLLCERLWAMAGGLPDAKASRSYSVATPEGPCMLITETFRRGMLMQQHATGP